MPMRLPKKPDALGWLAANESPSPEQLYTFIFQPGFSTKSHANAISGRGVGMDVVAHEVSKLRGTIDVTSRPGRGARVTLRLPSQLSLESSLIVRVAGQGLAVPASQIECVQTYEPSGPSAGSLAGEAGTTSSLTTGAWPTVRLPRPGHPGGLRQGRARNSPRKSAIVVYASCSQDGEPHDRPGRGHDRGHRRPGHQAARCAPGRPSSRVGNESSIRGELISVLNPTGLERWISLRRSIREGRCAGVAERRNRAEAFRQKGQRCWWSTTRSACGAAMARQLRVLGLEVHEVSDGMEALSRLRSSSYGLVVTDLEMPRLDGFALLAEMKRSARLAAIPVVVASTSGRRGDTGGACSSSGRRPCFQAG